MPAKFSVDVAGKLTTEHPMVFDTIDITYNFHGNMDVEMIKKVIQMSEEKYCGLTYMLREIAKFNVKVIYNGNVIMP